MEVHSPNTARKDFFSTDEEKRVILAHRNATRSGLRLHHPTFGFGWCTNPTLNEERLLRISYGSKKRLLDPFDPQISFFLGADDPVRPMLDGTATPGEAVESPPVDLASETITPPVSPPIHDSPDTSGDKESDWPEEPAPLEVLSDDMGKSPFPQAEGPPVSEATLPADIDSAVTRNVPERVHTLISPEDEEPAKVNTPDADYCDLKTLRYTNDELFKAAVFDLHSRLKTNFFILYHGKYGDVQEIDLVKARLKILFLDGTKAWHSIFNPELFVEEEEALAELLESSPLHGNGFLGENSGVPTSETSRSQPGVLQFG